MGKKTAAGAVMTAAIALLEPPLVGAQSGPPGQTPGSAPPASARPSIPQAGEVLDEDQIRQKLREEGYTEVTELRLQGPSYEAKATKDGRHVNLTVDARTGSIRSTY